MAPAIPFRCNPFRTALERYAAPVLIAGALLGPGTAQAVSCAVYSGLGQLFDGGSTSTITSYACGIANTATNESIAVGYAVFARGIFSTGLGQIISIDEDASAAFAAGTGITITRGAVGAIGLGSNVTVDAPYGVALGSSTRIVGLGSTGSVALGSRIFVGSAMAVALGDSSRVTAEGAVALGANSLANEANTVSLGNATLSRRLVNVANGIAASDAATVGQLQAAIAAGGGGPSLTDFEALTGRVDAQQVSLADIAATGSTQSTRVGMLESSLAAQGVELFTTQSSLADLSSQLAQLQATGFGSATAQAEISRGAQAQSLGLATGEGALAVMENSTAYGRGAVARSSVAVGDQAMALGTNTTAVGDNSTALGDFSAAYGNQSFAGGANSTALGNRAIANRNDCVALGANSVCGEPGVVTVGTIAYADRAAQTRRITNLADGMAANEAATVGQVSRSAAQTLSSANAFAAEADTAVLASANSNAAAGDAATLARANAFAIAGDTATLNAANTAAQAGDAATLAAANANASQGDAATLSTARSYTDTRTAAVESRVDRLDTNMQLLSEHVGGVEARTTQVEQSVRTLEEKAFSGIAMAFALGGTLPSNLAAGEAGIGVSVGSFKGHSALAIGGSKVLMGGQTSLGFGLTTSDKGDTGGRVSAFFKF